MCRPAQGDQDHPNQSALPLSLHKVSCPLLIFQPAAHPLMPQDSPVFVLVQLAAGTLLQW